MARTCFNKGWALVFLLALTSSRPIRSDSKDTSAGTSVCSSDVSFPLESGASSLPDTLFFGVKSKIVPL